MPHTPITLEVQTAFYFDQLLTKPENFWGELNEKLGGIFNATPIILPVPEDPELQEVPVVQMSSSSNQFRCNIARGRVDLFWRNPTLTQEELDNKMLDLAPKVFEFFRDKVLIKRIGFVTNFFVEDSDMNKAVAKLMDQSFKNLHTDDGSEKTHEVMLQYVSRISIEDYEISNITSFKSALIKKEGIEEPLKGLAIGRDFNTALEYADSYKERFNSEFISTFIQQCRSRFKVDQIIALLWPTE